MEGTIDDEDGIAEDDTGVAALVIKVVGTWTGSVVTSDVGTATAAWLAPPVPVTAVPVEVTADEV